MPSSTRTAAVVIALALSAVGLGPSAAGNPGDTDITLRPMKYSDLGRMIRSNKGKVIIVDFWAEY